MENTQSFEKKNELKMPNYGRYVGVEQISIYDELYNDKVVCNIQRFLAEKLRPFEKDKKKVVIDKEIIISVMQNIISARIPNVGNIYTHYIIPNEEDDISDIINRTIQVLYSDIKNEMEMEQNNSKLTIWSTLYGDFNKHGLRAHAPVKIRKNKPQSMLFNMNY
jgi:hypothetical protein